MSMNEASSSLSQRAPAAALPHRVLVRLEAIASAFLPLDESSFLGSPPLLEGRIPATGAAISTVEAVRILE
ncbi:hypothetical protein SAY86_028304 [Trapa natans]|uniref:Uncharacterized protein n=1 Tax=Trapa natans TaxID=22666 RepID=A0AAN7RGA0_TRANT|nr:hypothetical protein SAY86_028304 [Trapa natans]